MSIEKINLKEIPQASGVYWFINNDEVVYVGSSKNLYKRMTQHNTFIKKGTNNGYQTDLYQFLQNNEFKVQFQLTENYKETEQKLIETYQPTFNVYKAFTGIRNYENEADYLKQWQRKYHGFFMNYKKWYNNRECLYKGKKITLNALTQKFHKEGAEHPVLEAKKYLITSEGVQ